MFLGLGGAVCHVVYGAPNRRLWSEKQNTDSLVYGKLVQSGDATLEGWQ